MNWNKIKKLPNHIAYIIDGNGRWAKRRGLPRSMGHRAGINRLKQIVYKSFDLGIKVVSVYAFSTENWNRPQEELDYLFKLFKKLFNGNFFDFKGRNIKLRVMGDYHKFDSEIVSDIDKTLIDTKDNDSFILNLGLNYGGTSELIKAFNDMANEGLHNITNEDIENHLYSANLPPLDFVIRTSGEYRLSNFMLYQIAYSELYFPTCTWPEFNERELYKALLSYMSRDRRFGSVKEG